MHWDAAADEFLDEKRASGCSAATIELYGMVLSGRRTSLWREEHGIADTWHLDITGLRRLQTDLLDAGLSASTRHIYFRVMRTFARWCDREGFGTGRRATQAQGPRLHQLEPPTFTTSEIGRLLAKTHNARDRFVVELLLHSGLRLGEACQLTVDDLLDGPQGGWIRVVCGKWGKGRVVPADTPGFRLSARWRSYVLRVRPRTDRPELLLSPARCRKAPRRGYRPLSKNAVQLMLRRLGTEAGVPDVHAHRFRHTWATEALRAGVSMEALRRAGGWASYEMVRRYVRFQPDDLLEAWARRRD